MELDTEPRTVVVPDDLRGCAADVPAARAAFAKLSYSHQREYVQWIEQAKRAETARASPTRCGGSSGT